MSERAERISLINEGEHPELAGLIERIRSERGGRFLNLYRILAHSPGVCEGWLHYFTEIRQHAKLGSRPRELAILRVAILNQAPYEFEAHVPFALDAGIERPQVDAISSWHESDLFSANDRAVLAYTDQMTREIRVRDETFAALRQFMEDRELVELTATIAGYNMVSRFLEALCVPHEQA